MTAARKPHRWRRRLLWLAIAMVAARLLLALLLPWLLGLAARAGGLTLDYRAARLSLLGLSLQLDDVVLRDPGAGDAAPLCTAEAVVADVAAGQLLRGRLVVVDVALAGAHVRVVRGADGALQLPAAWQSNAPAQARESAPRAAEPIRLEAPLQIASLRVHGLHLSITDAAGAEQQFTFDAEVRDFGHDDRPCRVRANCHGRELVDRAELQATLALRGDDATAAWQLSVRGVRPGPMPWLDDPRQPSTPHVLGAEIRGELHAQVAVAPALPTVTTSAHVQALVDEVELLTADLAAGPCRDHDGGYELPLTVTVRGANVVDSLQVADTRLRLTDDGAELQARLAVAGLTLRRLEPWLTSVGVTLPTDGLDLASELRAARRSDRVTASLADLTFGSGADRFALPRITLQDLVAADGSTRIAAVEVEGPTIGITRHADGSLALAGVRLSPRGPARPAAATPPGGQTPFAWPRLAIERLQWTGATVRFADQGLPGIPAVTGALELRAERLALGQDAPTGTLTVRGSVPGAVGAWRADVDLTPARDGLAVECRLQANDMTGGSLAPWLAAAGLEPELQRGALRAQIEAKLRTVDAALGGDVAVRTVRLEDGDDVLLGLRRAEGTGLSFAATPDLGAWTIDEPFVAVQRQADGGLAALGLRLVGTATRAQDAPAATGPPAAAAAPPALPRHGTLELRRAVVRVGDGADPARDLSLGLDLRLEPKPADTGSAASFAATLRLDPGIGTLALEGDLRHGADGGRIHATVSGDSLRGAGLQAVLPPDRTCTLENGSLHARAVVAWQATSLDLRVQDVTLRDQGTELLAVDALDVHVPMLTPERVHVAAVTARGVRGLAATTPDGLLLPGLRIAPGATTAPAAPAGDDDTAPAPSTPLTLPALRVDAIDLAFERFTFHQRGATDGEPLVVAARLSLAEPWATTDDPEQTPPCRLVIEAAAMPLCRELRLEAAVAPFALAPTLDGVVRAAGIDTTALPRVLPALATKWAGTCSDGTFAATLHGRLDLRRRDPRRFDFGSAFGGELQVEHIDLRDAGRGETLLHVDEVALDLRAFDPHTGDVLLRSLEIEAPKLLVVHGPQGLDCCGVRLLPPSTEAAAGATGPDPAARAPAASASPEIAVDRVQVQGLDLTFRDPSTEPPTLLPLEDCDLKLLSLSSRALTEPRPIAFAATLHGGLVPLERRVHRSSVLAGLLGSAAEAIAGTADAFEAEQRPLLDEVQIRGQMQIHPQPKGQVRTLVHALELPALRGLAKDAGVDLADGVFDFELDARLPGAGAAEVTMRPKFTWLSLTEPPGGPISTYLKLPAPLDTVLFVLRNDDDEHVLPLRVDLPAAGLSGGAVAAAAAEALVRLIADAVASAAFRVGGTVTGAVGLGGGPDPTRLTASLEFAAGDPLAEHGSLDTVLTAAAADPELVVVLSHELGHGDLTRAAELACPPTEVVVATAARLGAARAELERERADLAGRTAALFSAGRVQDAWLQHRHLQAVDDRLGALVHTQEAALRMSLGESERTVRRRARDAAVDLATARLMAVRQRVGQQFGPDLLQRVEWRTPRGIVTAGLPDGGRVLATLRRRAAR